MARGNPNSIVDKKYKGEASNIYAEEASPRRVREREREEKQVSTTRAHVGRSSSPEVPRTGPVSLDECGSSHAYNRETWTEFKPIQGRWTGDG
ncbi:hypothetical protein ACS0PU_006960 [Formica fusca]